MGLPREAWQLKAGTLHQNLLSLPHWSALSHETSTLQPSVSHIPAPTMRSRKGSGVPAGRGNGIGVATKGLYLSRSQYLRGDRLEMCVSSCWYMATCSLHHCWGACQPRVPEAVWGSPCMRLTPFLMQAILSPLLASTVCDGHKTLCHISCRYFPGLLFAFQTCL